MPWIAEVEGKDSPVIGELGEQEAMRRRRAAMSHPILFTRRRPGSRLERFIRARYRAAAERAYFSERLRTPNWRRSTTSSLPYTEQVKASILDGATEGRHRQMRDARNLCSRQCGDGDATRRFDSL
jgi:hypothetical protein